ncbi:MAG: DUF2783 domain-containing protein, partial [Gammaproteobacteria bacterium]|nr:DUF2783 domain-containing protein [Gammaproteobacteria bacterium]
RLVLLLANHIGDQATLLQALQLARGNAQHSTALATTAERQAITPVALSHATA